jgi:hypothetical protein
LLSGPAELHRAFLVRVERAQWSTATSSGP